MSTFGNTMTDIGKALPVVGGVISALSNIGADKRQLQQQKALTDYQAGTAKEMAIFQQGLAKKQWDETNIGAVKKHIEDSGMNAALMLGGSGGASGTMQGISTPMPTGGVAANSAQTAQTKLQQGMAIANMGLIAAQTENVKADTAKKLVEAPNVEQNTAESGARQANTEWQTELSKSLGNHVIEQARATAQKTGTEADWLNAKWRAFENVAGDQRSEGYKSYTHALKAEWDKMIQDAQNAKETGNILKAQTAIENFKKDMAESGLSPDSPWYVKLLSEAAIRLGINPMVK